VQVWVRRTGLHEIENKELLVGDILELRTGRVPADGVLLRGSALVDECSLTGESQPVVRRAVDSERECPENLLFEGT
jgi:P-type E1-E2 ATPase